MKREVIAAARVKAMCGSVGASALLALSSFAFAQSTNTPQLTEQLQNKNPKPSLSLTRACAKAKRLDPIQVVAGSRYEIELPGAFNKSIGFSVGISPLDKQIQAEANSDPQRGIVLNIHSSVHARPGTYLLSLNAQQNSRLLRSPALAKVGACKSGTSASWTMELTVSPPPKTDAKSLNRLERAGRAGLETYRKWDFLTRGLRPSDPGPESDLIAVTEMRGLLQIRDVSSLNRRTVDGRQVREDVTGNLYWASDLSQPGEAPLPIYVTEFFEGGLTVDLDANADGQIDLQMGTVSQFASGMSREWLIASEFGEGIFGCLSNGAQITPNIVSSLESGISFNSLCPSHSSGGGDSAVIGGGFSGFPDQSDVMDPDCSEPTDRGPNGLVSTDPPSEQSGSDSDDADDASDNGDTPDLSPESAARAHLANERRGPRRDAGDTSGAPEAPAGGDGGGGFDGVVDSLPGGLRALGQALGLNGGVRVGDNWQVSINPQTTIDAARQRRLPSLGETTIKENERRDRSPDNGAHQPLPGETGGPFRDPRCRAKDQRAENGFADPHNCFGRSIDECGLRSSDPVFFLTGGRCRVEPGPAGGDMLTCQSNEDLSSGNSCPPDAPDCDETCLPNASGQGCRSSIPPGSGIAGDYLSIVEVGHILGGLCAVGSPNCPGGDPRIELRSGAGLENLRKSTPRN